MERHLDHAAVFVQALGTSQRAIDLGSGGGLPGLALGCWVDGLELTLVDASEKRCRFLEGAIAELDLGDRLSVRCGRAEELARVSDLHRSVDTVMARSFGAPAVTAECAVGFLAGPGARILVSEPPSESPDGEAEQTVPGVDRRWPEDGLALLGLERGPVVSADGASVMVLTLTAAVDDRYPRRNGVPAKRPLF